MNTAPCIAKTYDPKQVESRWYKAWLDADCFAARVDTTKEPFSIVMPPPNVTGALHMGHILNNTLQDILIRNARQQGKAVLWLPGTDHAGIATQTKIEKELRKEGITRLQLGRERFLQRVVQWRDKHGGIILEQLKRLGVSCDWHHNVHTLDPAYSRAVLHAFVNLSQRGYLYRGKRMVNWCPSSLTALSDEEVIMRPHNGHLYKIRYEIVEQPGTYLEIATTRPETIMGDTAVAVHPEDPRYQHLMGKQCWRPLPRAPLPIIGDSYVDQTFGTGVLKITPAHDKADFAVGQRHGLPIIDILNLDGTLNENAGQPFSGMDRFQARKAVVDQLNALGYRVATEAYTHKVGFSERAGVPIEPRLSEQWFLKYPKISEAKRAVTEGLIQFHPERWTKTYLHWLDNIEDWCISRQLWWGHRIPVWYRKGRDRSDPSHWHVSVEGPDDAENWEQDEDVLDTWASSWLWTFATLGWPNPNEAQALAFWNPTSVLVTAPDILFFWVARMIIASLEFKGEAKPSLESTEIAKRIPFKHVYFNGLIRDAQGRKMSKSLGNSPEPLDLIDKFGADGIRFGLLGIAPRGQDVLFSEERVQQGRNFCNKLWNACRFRHMNGSLDGNTHLDTILQRLNPEKWDSDDHAIVTRLIVALNRVQQNHNAFQFNAAHQAIYAFFWNDFCDWYLEIAKTRLQDPLLKPTVLAVQDLCIRQLLLMLHPFTPFITEALWHALGYATSDSEFIQNIPGGDGRTLQKALERHAIVIDTKAAADIEKLREWVSKARALKAQYQLASKRDVSFYYTAEHTHCDLIQQHLEKLKKLIGAVSLVYRETPLENSPAAVTPLGTLYLDLTNAVDLNAQRERLLKERSKLDKAIQAGSAKLKNAAFLEKAPHQIIVGTKAQLAKLEAKRDEVQRLLT